MSESTSAAVTTISFILVVTNVIGNSLVCWIIKKNRNMRYVGYKRRLRIGIKYSWLKFAKWMIFIVDLFLCVRRVSFPVSAEEAVALGGGGEGGKLWCWAGGGGKLWCWAGGRYYKENSEFMNTKHIQVRVLGWFTIVFWALLKIVIPFPKLRALLACVVVCCSY